MTDIGHHDDAYLSTPLDEKLAWFQNAPGLSAVEPARQFMAGAAALYTDSDAQVRATMRSLGADWTGDAATNAGATLQRAADWSQGAGADHARRRADRRGLRAVLRVPARPGPLRRPLGVGMERHGERRRFRRHPQPRDLPRQPHRRLLHDRSAEPHQRRGGGRGPASPREADQDWRRRLPDDRGRRDLPADRPRDGLSRSAAHEQRAAHGGRPGGNRSDRHGGGRRGSGPRRCGWCRGGRPWHGRRDGRSRRRRRSRGRERHNRGWRDGRWTCGSGRPGRRPGRSGRRRGRSRPGHLPHGSRSRRRRAFRRGWAGAEGPGAGAAASPGLPGGGLDSDEAARLPGGDQTGARLPGGAGLDGRGGAGLGGVEGPGARPPSGAGLGALGDGGTGGGGTGGRLPGGTGAGGTGAGGLGAEIGRPGVIGGPGAGGGAIGEGSGAGAARGAGPWGGGVPASPAVGSTVKPREPAVADRSSRRCRAVTRRAAPAAGGIS